MTTAAYLLSYGVLVTWLAPALLSRLTRRGLSPALGVAAWLTAIVGVLLAWAVAIALVVVTGLSGLPSSRAVVLCLELIGLPERVATPGHWSVLTLVAIGLLLSAVVTAVVSRSVLRARSQSREHASAARLVGVPTERPDVFVLTADRPAAYCVLGRPHAIVVTSAAVASLDESQLAAVLAHEDAHLAGRHHQLLMTLRALADGLPRLPLFTRGAQAVAELLEMCADDAAARRHGIRALVDGMVMLAGPLPQRAGGLGVAATSVFIRAVRLLEPVHRGTRWRHQLVVSATMAAIAGAPTVVTALCSH